MQTDKEHRSNTRDRIEEAIREMSEAGCKMTISGVAKEAGVSNATIHNRYPDLAGKIRELISEAATRDSLRVRRKRKGKVKTPKAQIKALRDELTAMRDKLARAHSANLSLDQENQSLQAENKDLKRQLGDTLQRKRSGNKRRIERM
jgi:AcrR family transcriptional regulator